MKIVILDGYALNPGDLDWEQMGRLGELTVYERTRSHEIFDRCRGAEIIFTNKTPLEEETLAAIDTLSYIGVLATGYNVVDYTAARRLGITVTNIPAYGTASVVQTTFALLLELCHHAQKHSDLVREGIWSRSPDWCFWNYPLVELSGKTMGILGFGRIGQAVADIAAAFGMQVIAYGRSQPDQSHREYFRWCTLQELFAQSDVLSLHCPLSAESTGIVNRRNLQWMKKTAFLLNTSRGALVVEEDLAEALANGTIAGAGLDVLSTEPPLPDNPLLSAKNCIITPHIAWATKEARTRLMQMAVNNLIHFLQGIPLNVIN